MSKHWVIIACLFYAAFWGISHFAESKKAAQTTAESGQSCDITMKDLRFTKHARERMVERRVNEREVLRSLCEGTPADAKEGKLKYTLVAANDNDPQMLRQYETVVARDEQEWVIITVIADAVGKR